MAATVTDITRRATPIGGVVTAMMSHPMDATIMFDVNHFTFRTTRTWVSWDISRVDFDLVGRTVRCATVRIEHNPVSGHGYQEWPGCKEFVVVDTAGTVLDDTVTLAAALGSAITSVMFEPMHTM